MSIEDSGESRVKFRPDVDPNADAIVPSSPTTDIGSDSTTLDLDIELQDDVDVPTDAFAPQNEQLPVQPSTFEVAKHAANIHSDLTAILKWKADHDMGFQYDRDFLSSPTNPDLTEIFEDTPKEYWSNLIDADSREQFNHEKFKIDDELNSKDIVARAGMTGGASTVAMYLASPSTFVPFAQTANIGRAAALVKSGLTGAVVSLPTEAARYVSQSTYDTEDILMAASFGFIIPGTVGAALAKPTAATRELVALNKVMDHADIVTPIKTPSGFGVGPSMESVSNIIDGAKEWRAAKGANDAAAGSDMSVYEKAGRIAANALGKVKIFRSVRTRLYDSPSDVVSRTSWELLEGGNSRVGRTDSAIILTDMYSNRLLTEAIIPLNNNYVHWAKSKGISGFSRGLTSESLDEYYDAIREVAEMQTMGKQIPADIDPHVMDSVNQINKMTHMAHNQNLTAGVEAFKHFEPRDGYITLGWQGTKISKVGTDKSIKVISKGYESVGIPADIAKRIAKAVVHRAKAKEDHLDMNFTGLMNAGQKANFGKLMREAGVDAKEIDSMFARMEAAKPKGAGFTKGRTKIDLNAEFEGVKVRDLVDNDLNKLLSRYIRQSSGQAGLARKGITSESDWDRLVQANKEDAQAVNETLIAQGKKPIDMEKLNTDLEDIKSLFDGAPIGGGINRNARRLQQWTAVSKLNSVGFAQASETGNIIGSHGFKGLPRYFTALKDVKVAIKKGDDELLDELRYFLGDFDTDHLMYRPDIVLDDAAGNAAISANMAKIDKGLGKLQVLNGHISAMNIARQHQHQIVVKMQSGKFDDLAMKGDAASLRRLEDIGIDPDMLPRVLEQVRKHRKVKPDGKLDSFGLHKWDDDVAEAYTVAMHRHISQVVQREIGVEGDFWMHRTTGALLTQFRTFPWVAFEKQLIRNIEHMDQELLSVLIYGYGFAYGVAHIRAAATGNIDKWDDQELMAKAGGQYMSTASLLPDVSSILAQMGVLPESFDFRSSTKSGGPRAFEFTDQIPVIGQLRAGQKAIMTGAKLLTGEDATRGDVRGSVAAVPGSSHFAIQAILKGLLDESFGETHHTR